MIFYHISWDWIYVKINPCAASVHFVSGRTDIFYHFFSSSGQEKAQLYQKIYLKSQSQSRAQSWIPGMDTKTTSWVRIVVSWQMTTICPAVCKCQLPSNYLRVKDWPGVMMHWWVNCTITQTLTYLSNLVLPSQGPLTPSNQLLCNSRKNHFLFHRCLSMAKIRDKDQNSKPKLLLTYLPLSGLAYTWCLSLQDSERFRWVNSLRSSGEALNF